VGDVDVWIPRAQILGGPTRIGERGTIVIPRWLADDLKLA
jgi:hypothetical protein